LFLDLLLPPTCASCDTEVSAPGQLCATCYSGITFIADPVCAACGLPFATKTPALCRACTEALPPWNQARAAMMYNDAARQLILPLKHADRTEIATTLAFHMLRAGRALVDRAELLVPVPLHRWRLLHRRYNQSALIARALGRLARRAVLADALVRTRATPSLGQLSAVQRSALLIGNIEIRPRRHAAITGRAILLIDDVLTSGATARACTRTLLDAGARSIDVLVASRVADPRDDTPDRKFGAHPDDDDADLDQD
jgi:ComF family protein